MQQITYRGQFGKAGTYLRSIQRAYGTFLQIPSLILLGFVGLFSLTYYADQVSAGWLSPVTAFMAAHVFADAPQTGTLLSSVASSLITVTSITVSVLLLAVQQSAASMTHQVIDQFLRRRLNQVIFGYFVGLALYAMVIHATVDKPFNPVIGATVVLILTAVALYLLLVLIYTTVNQMRPDVVVRGVRDLTLAGRHVELEVVARTVPAFAHDLPPAVLVTSDVPGYLTRLDIDPILRALNDSGGEVELEFAVSLGDFITLGDTIARVYAGDRAAAEQVGEAILRHIEIANQRDPTSSAGYGIEQLRTIGWTTNSGAKQNPSIALSVLHVYRDLIVRWNRAPFQVERDPTSPICYSDSTVESLFRSLEDLAVISSRSGDVMVYGELLQTFSLLVERLPQNWEERYLQALEYLLPLLKEFPLTSALDHTLDELRQVLLRRGSGSLVRSLDHGRSQMTGAKS